MMDDQLKSALEHQQRGFEHGNCPDSWPDCNAARDIAESIRRVTVLLASDGNEAIYVDGKLESTHGMIYAGTLVAAINRIGGGPVLLEHHQVSDDAWPDWEETDWPEDLESLRIHFED